MLGCVAFSVYCHAGSADKCKTRLGSVLDSALDLAAAGLCIVWRVGENPSGSNIVQSVWKEAVGI